MCSFLRVTASLHPPCDAVRMARVGTPGWSYDHKDGVL